MSMAKQAVSFQQQCFKLILSLFVVQGFLNIDIGAPVANAESKVKRLICIPRRIPPFEISFYSEYPILSVGNNGLRIPKRIDSEHGDNFKTEGKPLFVKVKGLKWNSSEVVLVVKPDEKHLTYDLPEETAVSRLKSFDDISFMKLLDEKLILYNLQSVTEWHEYRQWLIRYIDDFYFGSSLIDTQVLEKPTHHVYFEPINATASKILPVGRFKFPTYFGREPTVQEKTWEDQVVGIYGINFSDLIYKFAEMGKGITSITARYKVKIGGETLPREDAARCHVRENWRRAEDIGRIEQYSN